MEKTNLQPFYEALMQFLAMSKHEIVRIAAEYGLTSTQTFVLMLINRTEPRPMNSFCDMLGCDASNVTGLVDGLERKQLLTRAEHPHDRRIKVVQLLPKGQAMRTAILQRMSDNNQNAILSKLTKRELRQFTQLIHKMTN